MIPIQNLLTVKQRIFYLFKEYYLFAFLTVMQNTCFIICFVCVLFVCAGNWLKISEGHRITFNCAVACF